MLCMAIQYASNCILRLTMNSEEFNLPVSWVARLIRKHVTRSTWSHPLRVTSSEVFVPGRSTNHDDQGQERCHVFRRGLDWTTEAETFPEMTTLLAESKLRAIRIPRTTDVRSLQ